MRVDFCLPIYNEEKILRSSAEKLLAYCREKGFPFAWKIVLVVNGSSDSSAAIAAGLAQEDPDFFEVFLVAEKGRGRALKECWLRSEADVLSYMDIDLAVSLDNIEKLTLSLLRDEADLAIGSRLLPQSKIERSFFRELTSQSYNFLSRLILGHHFSDMQCGFKAVKRGVFARLAPQIESSKWFFDTELVSWAKYFGYRVKEVPVEWEENRYDQRRSKVNVLRDSLRFLRDLITLRWRMVRSGRGRR